MPPPSAPVAAHHRLTHLSAWQRQVVALLPAALAGAALAMLVQEAGAAPWLVAWIVYCASYVGPVCTWRHGCAQREDPDYLDLLYHSAVIGTTSQVSDVSIRSRGMRHLTLVHALLSFAFNLVVLATAVNVFASAAH